MLVSFNNIYGINIEKGTLELNEALLNYEGSNEHIPIIIVLEEQYDSNQLYNEVKDLPKKERRERTVSALKEFSSNSQKSIRKHISEGEANGILSNPKYLWITNAISVQASVQALQKLDKHHNVKKLVYTPEIEADYENDTLDFSDWNGDEARTEEVGLLITKTGADKAWEQGYYGQGVVVALLGSGVNYNKNDIKNNLWTHPDYPHHGYNYHFNTYQTYDDDLYSPGTQFAGIVAGDGTDGFRTGIAPKAKLMIVVVGSRSGSMLDVSATLNGIQFAIENNADIISIKADHGMTTSVRDTIRNTMVNTLSAGLIVVAGVNDKIYEKAVPEIVAPIADCPPPWLHPDQAERGGVSAVLTTAETDFSDSRWGATKGPVTWQDVTEYEDYPYDPGIGLIKPDLCAPGYRVTTLSADEEKGYIETEKIGISSAAVSGAIAIMLSKNPELTPEEITQILEENAHKLSDEKSSTFGSGRLEVFESCEAITDNRGPGVPLITSPLDESENVVTDPVFKWEKNRPTTSYSLYLGTDNPPTNLVNGLNLTEPVYKHSSALKPVTTYYWKLVAHHNDMSTESEVMSFNTELPPEIDFEKGEFTNYDWDFITTGEDSKEWYISDDSVYAGSYSARSGQIKGIGSTRLVLNFEAIEDGDITFYFKTSSEQKHALLRFYIGNAAIAEWSGENDWQRATFPIEKGKHSISWVYTKNTVDSHGQDASWIDYISLPSHYTLGVVYLPEELTTSLSYDHIDLSWNIEFNENVNPSVFDLQGFNLYSSQEGDEFIKLNDSPIPEPQYSFKYNNPFDYSFYVTAVYKIKGEVIETEPTNTVAIAILPEIAEPNIYPPSGTYNEPIEASIEIKEDAIVFYTIDGSEPDYTATMYEKPLYLTEPTILKAKAYKLGSLSSEIAVRQYIVNTSNVDEIYALPNEFTINLYPNPVRANSTSRSREALTIELAVPEPLSNIDINIYNIKGQHIRNFQLSNVSRGIQHVEWDLKTHQDRTATNGIYLLKIKTDDKHYHRRVMLLR